MKVNKNSTFDYLNPDFSMVKEKSLVNAEILPEHQFYLKHKIIHWLNKINEDVCTENNFEEIKINNYIIGKNKVVTVAFYLNNDHDIESLIHFEYDNENFSNFSFFILDGYKNKLKFPNTHQHFWLKFETNHYNDLDAYRIERPISIHGFVDNLITYRFNIDGVKTSDKLMLHNYNIDEKISIENTYENDKSNKIDMFDDFFNLYIDVILKSMNIFLELYPQFNIKDIDSKEKLQIFYIEMKNFYKNDVFNKNLTENLAVIKMTTI